MKKIFLIIFKTLFIFNISFADVVIGSDWQEVYKSDDIRWLVDRASIVKSDDKGNFYFLWLQTRDKVFRPGTKVKTRLAREEVNCSKKILKADLVQTYDITMKEGLSNKGNTIGTRKFDKNSSKWRSVTDDPAMSRVVSIICLVNQMQIMRADPEHDKKLKEFLKKQGIKTGTNN